MAASTTMTQISHDEAHTAEGRCVTVLQLPEQTSPEDARSFLRELERSISSGRPYLVLDCSGVCQMDKLTVSLLLHCLEQAMKCNGDVKLAGISVKEPSAVGSVGVDRLFEIFDKVEDAISSFHQLAFEPAADSSDSAA